MKFDKITQLRFLIIDWCLTDKEHKYTYEELTARMAEALFGDSSFSILPSLVDDDINAIQNYIAFDTQLYLILWKMEKNAITDTKIHATVCFIINSPLKS